MKKIKLKFFGTGLKKKYQANIKIYDNDNLIIDTTTYNGEVKICLDEKIYRLKATLFNETIDIYFYINSYNKEYFFFFNHSIIKMTNTITFLLKDYFYNLPIEKGELILWQNQ